MENYCTPIFANALSFAFEKATVEGKITITLLAIVSLVSWTVMITKFRQLMRARKMAKKFFDVYRATRDPQEMFRGKQEFDGAPAYEVYYAGAEELNYQFKNNPVRVHNQTKISNASFESVKVALERSVSASLSRWKKE